MSNLKFEPGQEKSPLTAWDKLNDTQYDEVFKFNEGYINFLNTGKTEREAVDAAVEAAERKGFVNITGCGGLKPGDRIYAVNRKKELVLGIIGSKPFTDGLNIVGAHIDSPRLDLKPQPFYEEGMLSLAKTHYYGGIKKYQWVAMPLALHGVAVKEDGGIIKFAIGEKPGDPVFTVTDLLPHLAKDQMEKKLAEGVAGEALNILVGGVPIKNREIKDRFKQSVLEYLNRSMGLLEEDFISADIEAVPAWPAADTGFDRGLVAGYGQDDRVCAYTALQALLDIEKPAHTSLVLLTDKEEVGSMGNTGMQSAFFENFVAGIVALGTGNYKDLLVRTTLANSRGLSADVNAGLDPNYEGVMDKLNAARLGCGVVLTKYTGSRGKSGSSEASAEFVAAIRKIFNSNNVVWQTGELGKVDQGGGGTIAYLLANYDMDIVDCGVALLGMHSPFEVASKVDVYMAYRAYQSFIKDA